MKETLPTVDSNLPPGDPLSADLAEPASLWPRVDALFVGEPPPPPVDVAPRVRRLQVIVGVAVFLDVVGLVFTVVPGAMVTLWAWVSADNEAARIETGGYDESAAAAVMGVRNVARWAMVFCVVCLLAQAWLLQRGLYDLLWSALAELVSGVLSRLGGAPS